MTSPLSYDELTAQLYRKDGQLAAANSEVRLLHQELREVRGELDAMAAVARRLKRGEVDIHGGLKWWAPDGTTQPITDSERRALETLSEGESDGD